MNSRSLAFCLLLTWLPPPADARNLRSQTEGLSSLTPTTGSIERVTHYLSEDQLKVASELSGAPVQLELWTAYRIVVADRLVRTVYFDTHIVRTQAETLMIAITPEGRVEIVEVVAFSEPRDYLPRPAWYGQFHLRSLDDELNMGRAIRPVTGATLSARAAILSVRRVLAVHRIIFFNSDHDN